MLPFRGRADLVSQIYIAFLLSLKFLNVSNLAMTNYYIFVMEYSKPKHSSLQTGERILGCSSAKRARKE